MAKRYLFTGLAALLLVSVPAIGATDTALGKKLRSEMRAVLEAQRTIVVLLDDEKPLMPD